MSAANFNTKNDSFRKLLGNGLTYTIPRFQRDYSWSEEEWEDLWMDIQGTLAPGGEPAHYMGYLVLQSADDKNFEVIDGQQRLTTLSLIVLAGMRNLKRLVEAGRAADANQRRLDQLSQTYIGYLDPVTLVARPKLTLNRNNNSYFQNYIVPLGHLPQRGFRASEHLLRKAFEWFDKRIQEHIKATPNEAGEAIARLIEGISDKLFFTVITVTDQLNAFKVFETLNARGVRLSATDLLKNYLFSVLHRERDDAHELSVLEDRWERMVGRLGSESFPDYLRSHWNSRKPFVRQAELFKTVRAAVSTREAVFALLRDMELDLDTYLALSQPEVAGWPPDWQESARTLRTFSVRQPFPLLMAAKRHLDDSDFGGLLRACVVISLRYNVIGSQPAHEQERVYSQVAQALSNGEVTRLAALLERMRSVYPDDEAFKTAFAHKQIRTTQTRNARVVRYLLCGLERQLGGADLDFSSDRFNLEHVFPQRPAAGWEAFDEQDSEDLAYALGNMTLLKSTSNREIGNLSYAEKRPVYAQSEFALTRALAEDHAEWTPERLRIRQRALAKQAAAVWRIAQLS